jgi:hypothetical protein
MIWLMIVPTTWLFISALLGVFIGRCIRTDCSEKSDATTAEVPLATTSDTGASNSGEDDSEHRDDRRYAEAR